MVRFLVLVLLLVAYVGVTSAQWRTATRGGDAVSDRAVTMADPQAERRSRSVLLAVGLSLILPGSGEWYAGNFQTGRYFMGADAALWLTYGAFVWQGEWIRDDARTYAGQHSDADFDGKDEQFGVNVGNFMTTDDYNQAKLKNREFALLYLESGFSWSWDEESNRIRYRSLRIKSDQMFQNSRFVVGALVVNRIISAFSAWRSAARYNKDAEADGAWRLGAHVQGTMAAPHGLGFTLTREF